MTESSIHPDLLACHDCDALYRARELPAGQVARCQRCGCILYRHSSLDPDRLLALSLTGLILFIIANAFPLLFLELGGNSQQSTLFSSVLALFREDLWAVAVLVFCTSILFPLLTLLGMIYLFLPLKFQRRPLWQSARVFRFYLALMPWGMTGVYLLGVLVAIIKLRDLATVTLGVALYAFAALLVVSLVAHANLEPRALWQYMDTHP